jgi:hypothetical protein
VTDEVPVLLTPMTAELGDPEVTVTLVIINCSVPMNPTLTAPIHTAPAMLVATVTVMSMIDATMVLRAFLLLLNFFIFSFVHPWGLVSMSEEESNLNLMTQYMILLMFEYIRRRNISEEGIVRAKKLTPAYAFFSNYRVKSRRRFAPPRSAPNGYATSQTLRKNWDGDIIPHE